MGVEIERKFIVSEDVIGNRELSLGQRYVQGYLTEKTGGNIVRVRINLSRNNAILCVKGPGLVSRPEFEFEIDVRKAEELIHLCGQRVIDKTRYTIESPSGHIWEVDEFHDKNSPLCLAEVELKSENEQVKGPDWLGEEVTKDPRYANAFLAVHPYSTWEHK
jgi:adenylate cyclase